MYNESTVTLCIVQFDLLRLENSLQRYYIKVMPWEMIEQRIAFRKVCYSLKFFTQPMTEKTVTPASF